MHFMDNQDLCLMKSAKLQRFSPTIAKPLFDTSKHNVELSIFDLAVSLDSLPNSRSADSTIHFFNGRNLLLSDVVQRTYPSNGGFLYDVGCTAQINNTLESTDRWRSCRIPSVTRPKHLSHGMLFCECILLVHL